MRNATELMVQYAAYHRDRRNITTHFIGIPLIVFAIGVLLARPGFGAGPATIGAELEACLVDDAAGPLPRTRPSSTWSPTPGSRWSSTGTTWS